MGKKSNKNKKKAYQPKPPFRTVEGIESLAYEMLLPNDIFVLMEFYRKFNGYNRSDLSLTAKDVEGRVSSATLSKSIWRLVAFGFLDIKRRGSMNRECSNLCLDRTLEKSEFRRSE